MYAIRSYYDLPRAALDARLLRKRGLDRGLRRLRVALGGADEIGGEPLAVVEQRLEQMLGQELLVVEADRGS